jgi:hypothetical protein
MTIVNTLGMQNLPIQTCHPPYTYHGLFQFGPIPSRQIMCAASMPIGKVNDTKVWQGNNLENNENT